jgi:NADPH:quinone reductase
MLAVNFTEFGDADVIRIVERPIPVPGAGEVVVKVAASTVNPTDLMMRAGRQAPMMTDIKPPYSTGVEFGGHVHALGQGVTNFAVGQPVMGIVNSRRPAGGAHAQYVCVPAASLAALAPTVDVVEAATIPMNGLTAKMVLELLDIPRGGSVLVTGGPGATGGYAIELAKVMGLVVVADAKESDAALLRKLGADHVVPRGDGAAAAVLKIFPNGVDGLIDAAVIGNTVSSAVRDGGGAVMLRRAVPITDPRLRVNPVHVFDQDTNAQALAWLADLARDGKLTPRIAMRLPLSQAVEANRIVERGELRGRVVLTMFE